MQEHGAVRVWPHDGSIECRCGHLGSVGRLDHFRIHGCEPLPSELEAMWRMAISWESRMHWEFP